MIKKTVFNDLEIDFELEHLTVPSKLLTWAEKTLQSSSSHHCPKFFFCCNRKIFTFSLSLNSKLTLNGRKMIWISPNFRMIHLWVKKPFLTSDGKETAEISSTAASASVLNCEVVVVANLASRSSNQNLIETQSPARHTLSLWLPCHC